MTGVEQQRLDVAVEAHHAVHLRFDVVVEIVVLIGLGELDQRHLLGHAHPDRLRWLSGKQKVARSSVSGLRRKCAEPKRGAPPTGSCRRFRAP
jgi:hypothetical protein